MKEQVYFPVELIYEDMSYLSNAVGEAIRQRLREALLFDDENDSAISALMARFVTEIQEGINPVFFNEASFGVYALAKPVSVAGLSRQQNKKTFLLNSVFRPLVQAWAGRLIKRETFLAYKYLRERYEADENGKTEAQTQTNVTGTSENERETTSKDAFNNGVTSSSTGTSNRSNSTENETGMTTGSTTLTGQQGYAREYAGRPSDFMTANFEGTPVTSKIADSFSVLFINVDELAPDEIGTEALLE